MQGRISLHVCRVQSSVGAPGQGVELISLITSLEHFVFPLLLALLSLCGGTGPRWAGLGWHCPLAAGPGLVKPLLLAGLSHRKCFFLFWYPLWTLVL